MLGSWWERHGARMRGTRRPVILWDLCLCVCVLLLQHVCVAVATCVCCRQKSGERNSEDRWVVMRFERLPRPQHCCCFWVVLLRPPALPKPSPFPLPTRVALHRAVAGGADVSVQQPQFGADGLLYWVSDERDGWWNLYRELEDGQAC